MSNDSALVRLLRQVPLHTSNRQQFLNTIAITLKDVIANIPLIIEFKSFLINIHDFLANESTDTIILSELYRIIRYCLLNQDYCDVIVAQDIHWILVSSIEVKYSYIFPSLLLAHSSLPIERGRE